MSPRPSGGSASLPIKFLQWAVGVVVLVASLRTFFHSAHKLAGANSPHAWFLPVLSGLEIAGAILFLVPRLSRIGSYVLLVVFGVALLFHVLHGDWEVGALVVYIAAVVVVRSGSGGW
jgi:uncharacterized membrane protein YphA (DoxX/SURF4 family)